MKRRFASSLGLSYGASFELGAGTCPYLEEWHERGYRYFGLDASTEMIEFSRQRARELRANLALFRGDMVRFALASHKFDLAYVLLGSLYVRTNAEFFTHLDSVSKVLNRGGSYLLDGVVRFNIVVKLEERWTMKTGRDQGAGGLPAGVGRSARTDLRGAHDPRRRGPRQDTCA